MAQDLEAAKTPNAKPVSQSITMPQPSIRKLSEILAQAQTRVQTPAAADKPPTQTPPALKLEEILPIEPSDPLRQSSSEASKSFGPEPRTEKLRESLFDTARGTPFPAPMRTALREAPLNLPTGLPEEIQTNRREHLPASRSDETLKPLTAPSPDIKPKVLSPEEILGFTTPKPKGATLPRYAPEEKIPYAQSPSVAPIPKKNLVSKKFVLFTGLLGVSLIISAGAVYWKIFVRETPLEPVVPVIIEEPKINEQPMPEALISYGAIEVIEIDKISYSNLKSELDKLKNMPFPAEFLVYTPVRLKTDKNITYLTVQELFSGLQINAPGALISQINEDFTPFLYSQEEGAERLCIDAGIPNKQCYGPRLGLVVGISDPDRVFSIMREWEKTMVSDLRPILFYEPQEKPEGSFKAGEYKNLETNFINLPIPTMSIDWILADNYLIIATSKEAARKVADRLK